MTRHPGNPTHDYPTHPNDLHKLPSVTDFEDALTINGRSRIVRSSVA